jgi:D-glycero-D-manno-heptose 1,7-bisphosphate phosphatase
MRCLFLDRDGVINIDRGYVSSREAFAFQPGLFPFLRAAQDKGYRLAIVTNQSGVARGLYTAADYESLTSWMLDRFRREGIEIALVLACFEHPEGTAEPYKRESFWRKPNPGMLMDAARRLRVDLARSAMLGDQERDMQAAQAAGVGICILLTDKKDPPVMIGITVAQDFAQALSSLA